jgi:hypothetical protein
MGSGRPQAGQKRERGCTDAPQDGQVGFMVLGKVLKHSSLRLLDQNS